MDDKNILTKIKQLMSIRYPLFAQELARTNLSYTNELKTAATDGKNIYINPDFYNNLSENDKLFIIAHELLHIKFQHMYRLVDKNGNRKDMNVWNIATDAIINANLERDGFTIPKGGVNIDGALQYNAEQLYNILLKTQQDQQGNNNQGSSNSSNSQNQGNGNNQSSTENGQGQSKENNDNNSQQDSNKESSNADSQNNNKDIDKNNSQNNNQNNQNSNENGQGQGNDNNTENGSQNESNSHIEIKDDHSLWEKAFEDKLNENNNNKTKNNQNKDNNNKNNKDNKDNNSDKDNSNKDKENKDKQEKDKGENQNQASADQKNDNKQKNKSSQKLTDSNLLSNSSSIQEINELDEFTKNRETRIQQAKERLNKSKETAMKQAQKTVNFDNIGEEKPVVDWKLLLRRKFEKDEMIWSQRRSIAENNYAYRLTDYEDEDESMTEVMLDVSGSISQSFIKSFLRQLKPLLKDTKLKVACFDTEVSKFTEIKTERDIDKFKIERFTGNTDLDLPVRSFSKDPKINKIVFTDGCSYDMPQDDLKKVNVIWIVYDNDDFHPCCGKVINVNSNEFTKNSSRFMVEDTEYTM